MSRVALVKEQAVHCRGGVARIAVTHLSVEIDHHLRHHHIVDDTLILMLIITILILIIVDILLIIEIMDSIQAGNSLITELAKFPLI